jgi:drug/metabolite transporter (DMT)-like permease
MAALAASATWGLGSLLFARLLRDGGTSPNAANLYKNTLAALCFLAILAATRERLPVGDDLLVLLASGALGFAAGDTLYFAALPRAGVQTTAVVCQIHTPLVVLIDWLVYDDMLPARSLWCIPLVLVGVLLVVFDGGRREADRMRRWSGIGMAAVAATVMAVAVVIGGEAMDDEALWGGTVVRMAGGIAGSIALGAGLALWRGARRAHDPARPLLELLAPWRDPRLAKALLVAAFFGSIIGLPLYHIGLRDLPSGAAAALFATTPLFTLPLGIFFGERHGWRAWVGTIVGFVGVVLLVRSL